MREAVIEKHLKDRARRAGGLCRKLRWIGRSGAPDRFLSLPAGHHKAGIWLAELKRPGKDAEEHQAREHDRLREAGVRVVVLASLEAVDNFFDGPEGGWHDNRRSNLRRSTAGLCHRGHVREAT